MPYSGTSSVTSDSADAEERSSLRRIRAWTSVTGIDGDGLLVDLDFLLIAAMAKFAFDFHISAFGQLGRCVC